MAAKEAAGGRSPSGGGDDDDDENEETEPCFGCGTELGEEDCKVECCGCDQNFCTDCAETQYQLSRDHPMQRSYDQGYYNTYYAYCESCKAECACTGICDEAPTQASQLPTACARAPCPTGSQHCTACWPGQVCFHCKICWQCHDEIHAEEREQLESRTCAPCKSNIHTNVWKCVPCVPLVNLVLEYARIETAADEQTRVRDACTARREELMAAFREVHLVLRDDSRLCADYITGESNRTVPDILAVMREMKFFHEHTHYSDLLEEEIAAARDHKGYYDRDECSASAQGAAIRLFCDEHGAEGIDMVPPSLHEEYQQLCSNKRRRRGA